MKLVLPIFFFLIFLSFMLLVFSSAKLNIKKCKISNINHDIKLKQLMKEFEISIGIYLFGKIKILNVKITENLIKKLKTKKIIKFNKKISIPISKLFQLMKNLQIMTEKFNLNLEIGNDSTIVTSYLVTIISAAVSIILRNSNYKNVYFKIYPNFKDSNVIRLNLSCVVSIKIIHIIYTFFLFMRYKIKQKNIDNRCLKFI